MVELRGLVARELCDVSPQYRINRSKGKEGGRSR